jgi:hypothetical protein
MFIGPYMLYIRLYHTWYILENKSGLVMLAAFWDIVSILEHYGYNSGIYTTA